jgi:hypothetical protein
LVITTFPPAAVVKPPPDEITTAGKNLRVKAKRRSVFRSVAKAALTHSKF